MINVCCTELNYDKLWLSKNLNKFMTIIVHNFEKITVKIVSSLCLKKFSYCTAEIIFFISALYSFDV